MISAVLDTSRYMQALRWATLDRPVGASDCLCFGFLQSRTRFPVHVIQRAGVIIPHQAVDGKFAALCTTVDGAGIYHGLKYEAFVIRWMD